MVTMTTYSRQIRKLSTGPGKRRFAFALTSILLLLLGLGFAAAQERTATIGMIELPSSLDPPTDWATAATWVHMNMFDCLIWRNRETAAFEPWLAESFENLDDTTWRFQLRQGVRFHNGEEFDAEAVVWTYQRILDDPTMITHNQWRFIAEINVLGPHEVEIVTHEPDPAFASRMAGTGCGIQAPEHGRQITDSGAQYTPVGTGPFMLDSWTPGDSVTLVANPGYWQGTPAIDRIVWLEMPEVSTRVANLITGDIDLAVSVPPQDWERVRQNPGTDVTEYLTTGVQMLWLRTGPSEPLTDWSGPTQDVRVRRAIDLAIDREALIDLIDGMGVPTMTRITPPTLGWDERFYDQVGEYDPERARELLAEAGYAGETLTFHSSAISLYQREVAQAITAMFQAVGLNVDLQIMDAASFREQVYTPYRNEEMVLHALGNSFFDPWIAVLSERGDRRERSGWHGPLADEADQLILDAAREMDPERRREMYVRVQELILEDMIYVYLYQMNDTVGMHERLQWSPPLDGFLWMGNAQIVD
jgi:peptide/nickel transport system substrate-binding protein